jgi:hypothetical protein
MSLLAHFCPAASLTRHHERDLEPVRLCPAPGKPCEAYWSGSVDLPICTQSTQSTLFRLVTVPVNWDETGFELLTSSK